MPASNRLKGRNVHIFDSKEPNNILGGLLITTGISNKAFHIMIEVLLIFQTSYNLTREGGIVPRNEEPLEPGNYYVVSDGPIVLNNEPCLTRTISPAPGSRNISFRNAVRQRDQGCIVSGLMIEDDDEWVCYQAAHVFPLAYQGHWNDQNFGRWITTGGEDSINSVQNGIILRSDLHALFDNYFFTINPDDDYKITYFRCDLNGFADQHVPASFIQNPHSPPDQILRWHFRQAVLSNVRAEGEPVFEHDFPPGADMIAQILEGPKAAERMEFELFSRLSGLAEAS